MARFLLVGRLGNKLSISVKDLFKHSFREWVNSNCEQSAGFEVNTNFWVVPIDKSDQNYEKICELNLNQLNSTKDISQKEIGGFIFWQIIDLDGKKLCIANKMAAASQFPPIANGNGFSSSRINFLQKAYYSSKFHLPAKSKIPIQAIRTSKSEPAFEYDLEPYLPEIISLRLEADTEVDSADLVFVKAVILLNEQAPHIANLRNELVEVAYSIPELGHEFVFDQLITAIYSNRLSSFFIETYKLFEFFFPINNIISLKNQIEFGGTELKLLELCKNALGWNMNHQSGSRSALSYAQPAFAQICLGREINHVDDETEQKFKEKGLELITNARHSLVHQDFRFVNITDCELEKLSKGLLVFLRDAFTSYKSKIAPVVATHIPQ